MSKLLKKLTELEIEANNFGLSWENPQQIMKQIRDECSEVEAHLHEGSRTSDLQEEIGDLLHAAFSLTVFCGFDPGETLQNAVSKFEKRFEAMKQIAAEQGLSSLKGYAFDDLMKFWSKAKLLTDNS